ncbi:hypothetical protein EDC96DRAFT_495624 [Choanephora cucurbitarum]|nr:hypothetical protein EDC96DRAFT_495624 [Choanephora cucurbitarum]
MTKRRNDDEGFANVLRQKPKEDLALKQEIGNKKQMQQNLFVDFFMPKKKAQNTFAMLMRAQKTIQQQKMKTDPSYQYFNSNGNDTSNSLLCHRCQTLTNAAEKCAFCENMTCSNCIQPCASCQSLYCSVCCILDYSLSVTQAFCLSCKQDH